MARAELMVGAVRASGGGVELNVELAAEVVSCGVDLASGFRAPSVVLEQPVANSARQSKTGGN